MTERYSKRMLEADSFDCSNTFTVPSTINEISEAEINEVAQADGTTMDQATMVVNKVRSLGVSKTITKVRGILTRNHGTTKIKSHGTRKYFCPTGFDEGILNTVTKLLHKKVE